VQKNTFLPNYYKDVLSPQAKIESWLFSTSNKLKGYSNSYQLELRLTQNVFFKQTRTLQLARKKLNSI
jgi:hypothetical protein